MVQSLDPGYTPVGAPSSSGGRSLGESVEVTTHDTVNAAVGVSDDELLARVRCGDINAYGVLYARYELAARKYACSLLRNESDAEDAVSNVFIRLLRAIQHGRGPRDTFVAYLFPSVRHECGDISRRDARRRAAAAGGRGEHRGGSADHATDVAEAAVVRAAFESLP